MTRVLDSVILKLNYFIIIIIEILYFSICE